MSRGMMICALATMLALSFACSAEAPNVIAQKLYDQLDQSLANHDLNQMLGFLDSNYVNIDVRGHRVAFAEYRKQVEQTFANFRNMSPSTIVQSAQLEAGRMVVYVKGEMHFELRDQREGWVPMILTSSGEETWERKGGQWKIVLARTFRLDAKVDPEYVAAQERIIHCCRERN